MVNEHTSDACFSIGVDCARYGDDETVLTKIVGAAQNVIVIDETGIGAGVVDQVKRIRFNRRVLVRGVHFGSSPVYSIDKIARRNKVLYANLKAQLFFVLAEDLKSKLGLLNDPVYHKELPSIEYNYNSRGKFVIESKEDYRKKGLKSPDSADSLALANWGLRLAKSMKRPVVTSL